MELIGCLPFTHRTRESILQLPNMRDVLNGVVVLGAVQSFFLATLLVNRVSNNAANRVYAAIQLLSSLALALVTTFFTGVAARNPWIYVVEEPLSWLFGPLVFLYARILLTCDDSFRLRDFWHFLPFVVNVAVVTPVLLWEPAAQLSWAYSDDLAIATLLRFAHGIAYSAVALLFVLQNRSRAEVGLSREEHARFRWLTWFIGLTGGIWVLGAGVFIIRLAGVTLAYPFEIATPLAGTLVTYVCGYISLRQPAVFGESARRTRMTTAPNADADMTLIVAGMERDHLWRDPNLTLVELANRVGIPSYRVSRAINTTRQESFFSFVNRYRVDEVRRVLEERPDAPLLSVALSAGFNAKSSFNAVFKRFTGTTPSQYRREMGTSLANLP